MRTFYLTFGQKSPAKNGWIEVIAVDLKNALEKTIRAYGQEWSNIYSEHDWKQFDMEKNFPVGKLGWIK